MLHKTAHSLSPPPRGSSHPPGVSNGVLYVPYPPPPHHLHSLPHGPPEDRDRIHSPHHLPPRDRVKSPSPSSTSPRRHSSHRDCPPVPHSMAHKFIPPPGPYYGQPSHYHPVHPGYPVRPSLMKRESSAEDKVSPKDDRSFPPPGLISVSGSDDMHRPSIMVESHVSLSQQQQQQQQQEGGSYHPVRRRGEAAAMVDIGHGECFHFVCMFGAIFLPVDRSILISEIVYIVFNVSSYQVSQSM